MGYIEENEQIIKELLEDQKIKIGGLINYAYFLELYEPYKKILKEVEFAEVLGISHGSYSYIKNKKGRTKVLKKKIKKLSEEEKEEIVGELIRNKKVKPGQSINYKEFQKLYETYKEKIKEDEFAELLGISYKNYNNLKRQRRKARVLKDKILKLNQKEKDDILQDLIENCKVRPGQSINYEEFQKLYETYKEKIKEDEFAGLLGINYSSYNNLKRQRNKARVLKDIILKMNQKEKDDILQDLMENCKVKPGQSINYKEFQKLYEIYKDKINEKEFARLLEINNSNYNKLKRQRNKARVLKDKIVKLNQKEKHDILQDLIENCKVKPGQLINYEEFQKMYEKYKEKIDEKEFAELLGITYANYNNLKRQRSKTRVLKDKIVKLNQKEKDDILQDLTKCVKLKPGQLINYEEFQQMYEKYKEKIDEKEFAELLGITHANYNCLKNKRNKSKSIKR